MKANVITIGDELLIGQTIDTNSSWLGKRLNEAGIQITEVVAISDKREQILETLDRCRKQADLILITGGLGPTRDDITKETLADYFGAKLVRNTTVESKIESFFQKFNRPVLEINRMQADLPDNCKVLDNPRGTAQGMLWDVDGQVVVSMPGVPYEMKYITENGVMPYIQEKYPVSQTVVHRMIITTGIGESGLADMIQHWEDKVRNTGFSLAYLPNPGMVKLRISYFGPRAKQSVYDETEVLIQELQKIIPEYYIGKEEKSLTKLVGGILQKHGKTVGVVESCTGGFIAHSFTKEPGCSAYFKGSITSYANQTKLEILGVNREDLETHGAVSEVVATQLAQYGKKVLDVDYCIATTGVAGPDGGSEEKPVGTVYTAVAGKTVVVEKSNFGGTRERIVERATMHVLSNLLKMLRSDFSES